MDVHCHTFNINYKIDIQLNMFHENLGSFTPSRLQTLFCDSKWPTNCTKTKTKGKRKRQQSEEGKQRAISFNFYIVDFERKERVTG